MRNKHLYPPNWPVLSRRCKELAGYCCERCGIAQGDERESRRGNLYRVTLMACHKDHSQRLNPDAALICLCARCHWWFDFEHWQLDEWRKLERLKHLRLLTPARIAEVRFRVFARTHRAGAAAPA